MTAAWVGAVCAAAALAGGAITHAVAYTVQIAAIQRDVAAVKRMLGLADGTMPDFQRADTAELQMTEIRHLVSALQEGQSAMRADITLLLVQVAKIEPRKEAS